MVSGDIEQGGSTITQQLVKNRLLSNKRDVNRKIREIQSALRLTEKFSKEKILEEYLNTVYFGQGSYGIKAAARRFFVTTDPGAPSPRGKRMDELTVGEAALLAGVISSPEANNPFSYPERAIRRRAAALRAQVELGYITQPQADAANLEPLPTLRPPSEQRPDNYLVAEVQDHLLGDPALGNTPEERRNKVLKGGLDVYTTFDPRPAGTRRRRDHRREAPTRRSKLGVFARLDRIPHRRGARHGRRSGLHRQRIQHRHPHSRPPTRIDVEDHHAHHRPRQRLLRQ